MEFVLSVMGYLYIFCSCLIFPFSYSISTGNIVPGSGGLEFILGCKRYLVSMKKLTRSDLSVAAHGCGPLIFWFVFSFMNDGQVFTEIFQCLARA